MKVSRDDHGDTGQQLPSKGTAEEAADDVNTGDVELQDILDIPTACSSQQGNKTAAATAESSPQRLRVNAPDQEPDPLHHLKSLEAQAEVEDVPHTSAKQTAAPAPSLTAAAAAVRLTDADLDDDDESDEAPDFDHSDYQAPTAAAADDAEQEDSPAPHADVRVVGTGSRRRTMYDDEDEWEQLVLQESQRCA